MAIDNIIIEGIKDKIFRSRDYEEAFTVNIIPAVTAVLGTFYVPEANEEFEMISMLDIAEMFAGRELSREEVNTVASVIFNEEGDFGRSKDGEFINWGDKTVHIDSIRMYEISSITKELMFSLNTIAISDATDNATIDPEEENKIFEKMMYTRTVTLYTEKSKELLVLLVDEDTKKKDIKVRDIEYIVKDIYHLPVEKKIELMYFLNTFINNYSTIVRFSSIELLLDFIDLNKLTYVQLSFVLRMFIGVYKVPGINIGYYRDFLTTGIDKALVLHTAFEINYNYEKNVYADVEDDVSGMNAVFAKLVAAADIEIIKQIAGYGASMRGILYKLAKFIRKMLDSSDDNSEDNRVYTDLEDVYRKLKKVSKDNYKRAYRSTRIDSNDNLIVNYLSNSNIRLSVNLFRTLLNIADDNKYSSMYYTLHYETIKETIERLKYNVNYDDIITIEIEKKYGNFDMKVQARPSILGIIPVLNLSRRYTESYTLGYNIVKGKVSYSVKDMHSIINKADKNNVMFMITMYYDGETSSVAIAKAKVKINDKVIFEGDIMINGYEYVTYFAVIYAEGKLGVFAHKRLYDDISERDVVFV